MVLVGSGCRRLVPRSSVLPNKTIVTRRYWLRELAVALWRTFLHLFAPRGTMSWQGGKQRFTLRPLPFPSLIGIYHKL